MRQIEVFLLRGHQYSQASRVASLLSEGFVAFVVPGMIDIPPEIEPVFIKQYSHRRTDVFVNNLELHIKEWKERQAPGFFDQQEGTMIMVHITDPLRPILDEIQTLIKKHLSGISELTFIELTVKGDPVVSAFTEDDRNLDEYFRYNERELYV